TPSEEEGQKKLKMPIQRKSAESSPTVIKDINTPKKEKPKITPLDLSFVQRVNSPLQSNSPQSARLPPTDSKIPHTDSNSKIPNRYNSEILPITPRRYLKRNYTSRGKMLRNR